MKSQLFSKIQFYSGVGVTLCFVLTGPTNGRAADKLVFGWSGRGVEEGS